MCVCARARTRACAYVYDYNHAGGRVIIKKKDVDIGNQDKRAEAAAKAELALKKSATDVSDAKARFLARKAARAGGK